MIFKKDINKDFKKELNHKWLKEKIKYSVDKYDEFKCKNSLETEIYIKHDFSPEIIEMEEKLERPITCEEYDLLVFEYIKLTVKMINKK